MNLRDVWYGLVLLFVLVPAILVTLELIWPGLSPDFLAPPGSRR